ncbi:hypothetical protein STA3757_32190 [Stanieria sp. NIES-3757]|nr:hypothetical protein STA3757_32190 [Stanieria sp. NIES-3757]
MIEQQQLCHVLVTQYPQSKRPLLLAGNTDSLGKANNSILKDDSTSFNQNFQQLEYSCNFNYKEKQTYIVSYLLEAIKKSDFLSKLGRTYSGS